MMEKWVIGALVACSFALAPLTQADARGWTQTPASGMGDVAVAPDGTVWLAGDNGTIWSSTDGANFDQIEASGFESLAAGSNGRVWAVGTNGTLWRMQ